MPRGSTGCNSGDAERKIELQAVVRLNYARIVTSSGFLSRMSAFPLLGAFALYFLLAPFLPPAVSWVFGGVVVGTAVLPLVRRPGVALFALLTGALGLALSYLGLASGQVASVGIGLALLAVQIATVIGIILTAFLRLRDVSPNALAGAAAGYLLLGFLWAAVYGMLEIASPGAITGRGLSVRELENPLAELVYYSYVTLTTVGYGDIVPEPGPARSLAVLEAVSGQLYIAFVVAGLVGRYATERNDGNQ